MFKQNISCSLFSLQIHYYYLFAFHKLISTIKKKINTWKPEHLYA